MPDTPWITAAYDSECADCGNEITGGEDEIRSDGQGGWLCILCGQDDDDD